MLLQGGRDHDPLCKCVFEWYKRYNEHKKKKYDFISGNPSTSRTEDNVEQVKQVVSEDRRLTEQMSVGLLDLKNGIV